MKGLFLFCISIYNAFKEAKEEMIIYLIKSGVSVNEKDKESGSTPLHYACEYGHINIVELLLRCGADINAINNQNNTSLLVAITNGNLEITKYL